MIIPILAFMLSCPNTQFINESSEPIGTKDDVAAIKRTRYVCKERYGPQSPCLKQFIKKAPRRYWAICGAPGDK